MLTKLKAFAATALAVVQLVIGVIGITPQPPGEIDYGGVPYEQEAASEWLLLAGTGAPKYSIVISAEKMEAEEPEHTAAVLLRDYFEKICGATLEIVSDSNFSEGNAIFIGKTALTPLNFSEDYSELKSEGFVKKVEGSNLFLYAEDGRGAIYAVSSLLEEQLGCRWFTPDLSKTPQSPVIKIDKELDDMQNPYFEYRDDYWNVVFNSAEWKTMNKINSRNGAVISPAWGDDIRYADFAHSMDRLIPESMFEEDETLFAFRKEEGEWKPTQRCLTNPEVLRLAIENTRATLRQNPGAQIMSITQCDNSQYCQCSDCEASDARLGGPSGTNIWFVNQVARALKEEFPLVAFDTFAYQYTRAAPTVIVEGENIPDENVIVRLCSIECCFCHPLNECGHERGEELGEYVQPKESTFAKDIKDWAKICDRLYIWDYTTNFKLYLMPFMNFHVLGENMQFFVENNVRGVFEQGNYTGGKSGEFGELRAYVIAKLLWDPWADVEYHMMDFMKAYYGEEAAEYIKEYIDIMTQKTVDTSHLFIFNWHYENTFLRAWNTRPLDKLWDAAENSAKTEEQLQNIRRSRLSLRFYKSCMLVDEFGPLNLLGRAEENKKLYYDMVELGITRMSEHSPLVEPQGLDWQMRPVEWLELEKMPWNS